MLARTASARSPLPMTTGARVSISVATARNGIASESKLPRAIRFPRSMSIDMKALISASRTAPLCST